MQFYLDGFYTGDPEVHPAADRPDAPRDEVDVLIVGCGPAGLVLAAQLAAFPEIRTRIIERKPGPLELGQADGVACRSVEMFEAFGVSEKLLKEAYWVNETVFWRPDEGDRTRIVRSGRIQDVEDGLSEMPHVIVNQARVHDYLLEVMRKSPTRLVPDYGLQLRTLTVDEHAEHPVTVTAERLGSAGGTETIKAKYVVGCDGARSAVREAIGRRLVGDLANQAWGVMDVLAVTDFPDIRLKAAIHSGNEGNLLIIPREGGYLVRLYIELDKLAEDQHLDRDQVTPETLADAARRILHPYTLDVKEVAWWSVYEIGQRLTDRFDDAPDDGSRLPRVFIAGDACHTHSAKAGQGMNVSMADAFNLGWKLAGVLRGTHRPGLLHTYSAERQVIAQELIDFDREFAKMFSAEPKSGEDDADGVDPAEFQAYFVKQGRFTAGTATHYAASPITAQPRHRRLAEGLVVGMRFHSAPAIRLADAKPVELGHVARADGRWRIYAFADRDGLAEDSALQRLCRYLNEDPASPVWAGTGPGADVDAVIDVRAILQDYHRDVALQSLPPLLLPAKGRHGLLDYEKVFCPDLTAGTTGGPSRDVYDLRGIDRERGAMVVVRPDQYVAAVLPLDAHADLAGFFGPILVSRSSKP